MANQTSTHAQASMRNRLEVTGIELLPELLTETLDVITRHTSVRRFMERPIPPGTLEALVTAAQSAPTSSTLQAYSIINVTDPVLRDRVATLSADTNFIRRAPLFLIFCPDVYRLQQVCERQGKTYEAHSLEMFLLASVDAALAAQCAATAAASMGMGTVMCGSIRNNPDELAEALGLPPGVYGLMGLAAGYPDEAREIKPRLPMSVVLHDNRYDTSDLEAGLSAYDRSMAEARTYDGRKVSFAGEPVDESRQYGWCEHTARRLSQPETIAASTSLRENLRRVLEARGWRFD